MLSPARMVELLPVVPASRLGCPNCDVPLCFTARSTGMPPSRGHREVAPRVCPDCDSVSVARHGAGTEQLERELEELVAPLPVFRLDSDVAAAAGVATVLRRFDEAPAGILVGTQMVAKGHDFPEDEGVVLDADATLRFPDFRSEERTFALVAQLAGRSGRGERGGRVIVQALDPSAESLRFAARHDSEGFLEAELHRRELLSYPPHGHLIRVVCSSVEPGPYCIGHGNSRHAAAASCRARPSPLFRMQARHRAARDPQSRARPAIAAVRDAVERFAGSHPAAASSRSTCILSRRATPAAHARVSRVRLGLYGRGTQARGERAEPLTPRGRRRSQSTEASRSPITRASDALDPSRRTLRSSIPRPSRRLAAMPSSAAWGSSEVERHPVDRFDDSLRRQVSAWRDHGDAYGVDSLRHSSFCRSDARVWLGPMPRSWPSQPELEWTSDDQRSSTRLPSIPRSRGRGAPHSRRVRALDD